MMPVEVIFMVEIGRKEQMQPAEVWIQHFPKHAAVGVAGLGTEWP